MSLTERDATAEATPERGVQAYRIADSMDSTGRMTVRADDGATYTVVGTADERTSRKLRDRARGARVRMELTPAPSGTGYLVARVRPGGLPPL